MAPKDEGSIVCDAAEFAIAAKLKMAELHGPRIDGKGACVSVGAIEIQRPDSCFGESAGTSHRSQFQGGGTSRAECCSAGESYVGSNGMR